MDLITEFVSDHNVRYEYRMASNEANELEVAISGLLLTFTQGYILHGDEC